MSGPASFSGFPAGTLHFLRDLAANNTRAWFDAHRPEYEEYYLTPAVRFVDALGPLLRAVSPTVQFDSRVNGSLFRIQRDVRFAKDKRPYKTHLDMWFWEGSRRGWDTPNFYFRLTPDRLILGAGIHRFEHGLLTRYRSAVLDPVEGRALEAALAEVRRAGPYQIGESVRKAVPRGFDPQHERAGLLRHEGLTAGLEMAVPSELHSAGFPAYCAAHYRAVSPVIRWLADALVGQQ